MNSMIKACIAIGVAIAPAVAAEARARDAAAIVAASKRATGGAAWDRLTGCYEEGLRGNGKAAYRTWFSFLRYGMRLESEQGGSPVLRGFNGTEGWQVGKDGSVQIRRDREAVVTAYLSNNGFYFPQRFPATFAFVRRAEAGGRRYDVVDITPQGGRAIEIWFDRATHLIGRVVDHQDKVTVEAADYRRVGGILLAYSLTVTGPDGTVLDKGRVTSVRLGPVDPAQFDPPPKG